MFRRILIPTDGSKRSENAIREGVCLARRLGASVIGFIATPSYKVFTLDPVMSRDSLSAYEKHSRRFAERALKVIKAEATGQHVPCEVRHVVADQPYKAILSAVKRSQSDLIVMASHGRTGVAALLLGSETQKVLTHSKIPVLICR